MARKDLLKNVLEANNPPPPTEDRAGYAMRGASKQMRVSIDSLVEASRQLLEGEAIVEIDPALIDASFVNDRLTGDDEAFEALKSSIAQGRQDTPVLLRPHPTQPGRFMTVFGHRRIRVARELGRPVRAVVKQIDDVGHVLAQGQENTARADLSFVEKAIFARNLLSMGHGREVIQGALAVDKTLLSRMLAVSQTVPPAVIVAIGPAKDIGRDRWEELKRRIGLEGGAEIAEACIARPDFKTLESNRRFERLFDALGDRAVVRRRGAGRPRSEKRAWTANEGRIKGVITRSGKAYSLSLTSKDAAGFGGFLTENLDRLYQSYLTSKEGNEP